MKSRFSALLSLILLFIPLTAFAANKSSQKVTFSRDVTINGTQLQAGTYSVQWDGTGNVTATILQGKKVVATAPAVVTLNASHYDGALELKDNAVRGILWKNVTLQFDEATSASGN